MNCKKCKDKMQLYSYEQPNLLGVLVEVRGWKCIHFRKFELMHYSTIHKEAIAK